MILCSNEVAYAKDMLTTKVSAQCSLETDIRRDEKAACWRLLCRAKKVIPLGCDLTQMHQITSLSTSPNHQWLAVISVGEGHPILELVNLPMFIDRHQYSTDCIINPFPSTLNIIGWDRTGLLIESDVDLAAKSSTAILLEKNQHFRVVLNTCTITAS
jgi:hypothetical protein